MDILQQALNRGIIDLTTIQQQVADMEREKILKMHPYKMWQDFLEEQIYIHNLKAKAFSNLKTVVRGMLKRAKKNGLIHFNITEMLDDMDVSDRDFASSAVNEEEEIFTEEEYPRVVEYLLNNLDVRNLGILLMFETGIRIGELITFKFANPYKSRLCEADNGSRTRLSSLGS